MKINIHLLIGFFFFLLSGCDKHQDESYKSNFSVLNVEFEDSIPIRNKTNIMLFETIDTLQFVYKGKIERRGGSSISFPKHSYEIDLKKDVPLAKLPADDDWILNANYIDKTFLRHVVCYELFAAMADNNIASECQYVELELNGEYNGLYVLMEKLDKSSLELNDSDSLAFIFKEPHIFRDTYDGIIPQHTDNFHQQTFPKIKKENKRAYIEELRGFILNSNDDEFGDRFSLLFDSNNIMDWHLLLLVSNNSDGTLKNFYLYKKDNETPIRVAPWDYDHSFGRDGDNELNLDERPLNINRSILFRRLLQCAWYKIALKQRWEELNNKDVLSKRGLKRRILDKKETIKEAAKKNFEIWAIDSSDYYDSNNFDQEVDIMLHFIDLRHERLQMYFDEL